MNSFGRIFRITIFGESHGHCVGVNIDGCPAGMPLSVDDFTTDIDRRKAGAKGTTPRKEDDIPRIMNGVFNDKTTGAPSLFYLTITIQEAPIMKNKELCQDQAMQIL